MLFIILDMFSEDDIEAQCRKIFEDNPKSASSVSSNMCSFQYNN